MSWTIRGESGVLVETIGGVTYGLNNTERTFAALGISQWQLGFKHLAADFFTYTVRTQNAKGQGTIVPRDGQEIHIYYDGVRKFKGHVVKPKLGLKSLQVTALGPWYWMEKIPLSGIQKDGTGANSERTSFVFPVQGLAASLVTLINRAETKGVPMKRIGNETERNARITAMYPFLKTTLSNMSFAAAITELMSAVPDAVAWFDYTESPPALNITRRWAMTALSFTVGSEGSVRVESAEILPRTEQEVKRIELKYAKRQGTNGAAPGKIRWATQASGSAGSSQEAKKQIQIVTVSGPETLAYVPKTEFDSVTLKTKAASFGVASWFSYDSFLKDAKARHGSFLGSASPWVFAGWNVIESGETAEWMRKDYGLKTKDLRVQGWVAGTYVGATGVGTNGLTSYLKNAGRLNTWTNTTTGQYFFRLYVDFTVPVINLAYPTKKTIYRKWDWDFINLDSGPLGGLAENLLGAQNFTPWEGPITIVGAELDGYNALQRKINLVNGHPGAATMNALLKAVTYDGTRRRITYDLGPPPRADLGGLVNKMRRSPQDNVVWLADPEAAAPNPYTA